MSLTVDQAETLLVKLSYAAYPDIADEDDTEPVDGWGELAWELRTPQAAGNHTVKTEEDFGGEGKGDQRWVVFSIATGDETQYFRKSGWYASHVGSEWDGDLEEVTPIEKIVRVWK